MNASIREMADNCASTIRPYILEKNLNENLIRGAFNVATVSAVVFGIQTAVHLSLSKALFAGACLGIRYVCDQTLIQSEEEGKNFRIFGATFSYGKVDNKEELSCGIFRKFVS